MTHRKIHTKSGLSRSGLASLLLGCIFATSVLLCPRMVEASLLYTTDFEGFPLGQGGSGQSIVGDAQGWGGNGRSGLSGGTVLDAEIVDSGGANGRVFRISNAVTSGNYDVTHPTTPTLSKVSEATSLRKFNLSFDFRSASNSLQDGLAVDVTLYEAGTSNRQGIIRISDDATDGFSVGWWEVNNTSGAFNFLQLATGLARDQWHSVALEMNVLNGSRNDVVTLDVNGSISTADSWEAFYEDAPLPLAGIDSAIFRVAGSPVGGVAGGGVYFDNLIVAVPEPSSLLALLGLSFLSLCIRRKRE